MRKISFREFRHKIKVNKLGVIQISCRKFSQVRFSCPQQLNRWPCHSLSNFYFWHYRVTLETCDLWDIWSEWWGDMTWPKKIYLPTTYLPTYLPTYLCTSFREHQIGAILETCDLWDIWSERWEDMTWSKNTHMPTLPTNPPTQIFCLCDVFWDNP